MIINKKKFALKKVASLTLQAGRLTLGIATKGLLALIFGIVVFNIVSYENVSRVDQALMEAVEIGNLQAAQSAIARGAKVNHTNLIGSTPLHAAAWRGDLAMAKLLIEEGAQVNITDTRSGETPLHSAARGNEPAMTAFLLEAGADPHARTHTDSEQCNGMIYPAGITAREITRMSGFHELRRDLASELR